MRHAFPYELAIRSLFLDGKGKLKIQFLYVLLLFIVLYVRFVKFVRHWLYGEIQERDQMEMNPTERRALRGWFPRICCSPLYFEFEKDEKND